MKKRFLLLAALLPLTVFAQNELKLDVHAGATYGGVRGSDAVKPFDPGFDYLAGAYLEIPVDAQFTLVTGLNYERKTHTYESSDSSAFLPNPFDPSFDPIISEGRADFRFTSHYLTLPVNIRYYIGTQKRFYINGGIFLAYLLDETGEMNDRKTENTGQSASRDFDFGVNLGIGYRIPLNEKNNLLIELRDNLGLSNTSKISGAEARTNAVNLTVGWQFGL